MGWLHCLRGNGFGQSETKKSLSRLVKTSREPSISTVDSILFIILSFISSSSLIFLRSKNASPTFTELKRSKPFSCLKS